MRLSVLVTASVLLVSMLLGETAGLAQRAAVLRGVKAIRVTETVVPNPSKVKEDFAPVLMEDSVRNALLGAGFEITEDAPVSAHFVLNEFTSGSTAKRFLVGFGAGRSTVDGQLVFKDADGAEIAVSRVRARGNLAFSSYQGGNRQREQAVSALDQRLREEIARLR
jgi:hypothetical protein